jgi:S1-C subfamily serine protease
MALPFRALALALPLMALPLAAARQGPGVLHIKVIVVDAAGRETPVPRYLLLISENPASAPPRRVFTSAQGTADVRLPPGSYTIESDEPFAFQGRTYQWTQVLDMPAGRDASLELSAVNSDAAAAVSGESPPPGVGSSSVLAEWQGSVVSVWTPTAFGSAFAIDARGLVATSRRVVGSSTAPEVQMTPALKVSARVLATDPVRDVAILWIDPGALQSVPLVPLECGPGTRGPARGDEILALGTNVRQQKRVTSGRVNGTAAHLMPSTLMLSPGSAGGPVFLTSGALAGLSTTFAEDEQASGESRVVPTADICAVLASAETKMKDAAAPDAARLPVEPSRFADAALIEAAKRNPSLTPYRLSSSGFEVALITPAMIYASRNESEDDRRRRQQRSAPRNPGPEPRLDPLENFSNWSSYLGDVPAVLLVRVTPRLVEGFWTKVARGAAQTHGVSIPPIKRFKPGFSHLRAFCGAVEVPPVHPFKLEQRVTETDAIYEGLYAFAPGALSSSCGTVKLTFYADKDQKGDTRVVDPKLLQQIDEEFASYGQR